MARRASASRSVDRGETVTHTVQEEPHVVMSRQERNKRRAQIVRRWSAYHVGQAQREIWRKRRAAQQSDDFDEAVGEGDLLAELPGGLLP